MHVRLATLNSVMPILSFCLVLLIHRNLERVAAVVKSEVGSGAFRHVRAVVRHGSTFLVAGKAGEGPHVASGRRSTGDGKDDRQERFHTAPRGIVYACQS